MKNHKKVTEKYEILLVEDGSIDIDDITHFIEAHNLKIKIIVYRQGSLPPKFLTRF